MYSSAHASYGHNGRKLESIITLHKNAHTEKRWKRVVPSLTLSTQPSIFIIMSFPGWVGSGAELYKLERTGGGVKT